MKNNTEIQDRIRALLDEELSARVAKTQERVPVNCRYNYRHPLDTRKYVYGEPNDNYNRITKGDTSAGLPVAQTIGLCIHGSESPDCWKGIICEEIVDALRCPPQAFTPKVAPEVVKAELELQIKDLAWLKDNMPTVHTLLWVLGLESEQKPSPEPLASSKTEPLELEIPKIEPPPQEPAKTDPDPPKEVKSEASEPEEPASPEEEDDLTYAAEAGSVLEKGSQGIPWWKRWFLWLLGFRWRRPLLKGR